MTQEDLNQIRAIMREEIASNNETLSAAIRTAFNAGLEGLRKEFTAGLEGLRTEFTAALVGLRTELNAGLEGLRTELNAGLDGLRTEFTAGLDGLRTEFNDRLTAAVVAIRQDFAERIGAAAVAFVTNLSEVRKELGHRIDVFDDALGRRMDALERRMDRIAETTGTTATELAALTRWANRLDRENLETLNNQAAQQRAIDELAKRLRPPIQPPS